MTSTSTGLFWTHHSAGMMSAALVVPLHAILRDSFGTPARDRVFADAGFDDAPPSGENLKIHESPVNRFLRDCFWGFFNPQNSMGFF